MNPGPSGQQEPQALLQAWRETAARYERLVLELSLLRRIDELSALIEETDTLCLSLVNILASELSVENCSIMLLDPNGVDLVPRAVSSPLEEAGHKLDPEKHPGLMRFRIGEGVAGRVAQTGHPIFAPDTRAVPSFLPEHEHGPKIGSLMCFPLMAGDQLLGVLNLSHSRPGFFNEDSLRIVTPVADRIGRVLMTHHLYSRMRDSEQRYRLVAESAGDGIIVFDLTGDIVSVNPAIEEITGIPEAEYLSSNIAWETGIHPEDLDAYLEYQCATRWSRPPEPISYRYLDRRKKIHYLEQLNARYRTAMGKTLGTVAVIRDVTERTRTEDALRRTQERLELALHGASLGLWDWDIRTSEVVLNNRILQMYGDSKGYLRSRFDAWKDRVHPEDLNNVLEAIRLHLKGETESYQAEFRARTDAGNWVWMLSMGRVVERDESGRALRMVGIQIDISDRKQMEEELRTSEDKFRALSEASIAATFIYQNDAICYVNPAAVKITGFQREELLEMPFWQFIHPDFQELVRKRGKARLQGEPVETRYELKIIRKSGEERWVDFSGATIPYEGKRAVLGVVFDITGRKRAEEALRQSEQYLASVLQTQQELICRFKKDTTLTFVNEAYCRYFGMSEAELLGFPFLTLVPESEHPAIVEGIAHLTADNPTQHYEHHAILKDGALTWQEWTDQAILDDNNQVIEFQSVGRDITERKLAEEALRLSEIRYRNLFEFAAEAILVIDTETHHVVEANSKAETLFGYSADELRQYTPIDLSPPLQPDGSSSSEKPLPYYEAAMRGETPVFEWLHRNAGGKDIPCEVMLVSLTVAGRMMVRGSITDITERVRAREAIIASEERYRSFVENTPVPISRQTRDRRFIFVNRALRELIGLQETEVLELNSQRIKELLHPDDLNALLADLPNVVEKGARIVHEIRLKIPDGRWRWFLYTAYPWFTPNGEIGGIEAMGQDITGLRQAEQALRRRDAILEAVAYFATRLLTVSVLDEGIEDGLARLGTMTGVCRIYIFENNPDHNASGSASERYVWRSKKQRKKPRTPILKNASFEENGLARWEHMLANGEVVYGITDEFPPGEQAFMAHHDIRSIALVPVFVHGHWWGFIGFDECNEPRVWTAAEIEGLRAAAGILGAAIARWNAEQTIAEQRLKMVSSSRLSSLGVLASGVAHEINNPLAVISIGVEQLNALLSQTAPDLLAVSETGQKIRRNVSRIERIIRGMRNLSRDGSDEPFAIKPLRDMIEEILELCRARFELRGIELIVDEIPGDLAVECQGTMLTQVLMNLLNNAYDAVEDAEVKWVRIGFDIADAEVFVGVCDSGPGVPEQYREKIMEPFFTTKTVGRGTGLGLSISKAIAESQHGELFLDTDSPHTRFVLRVPRTQPRNNSGGDGS